MIEKNKQLLIFYYVSCVIGAILILPFSLSLINRTIHDLTIFNWILVIIQSLVMYAIVVPLGYYFSKKMDLLILYQNNKSLMRHIKNNLTYILGFGLFTFLILVSIDLIFSNSDLNIKINPIFGLLASFYGGINEEIINRFFLTSFIAFLLVKILNNKNIAMWTAISITSLLFGLLHLPITAAITTLTFKVIARGLLLNGIAGMIFGWLFWKKGIEIAIITHFFVDICLYVLLPIFKHLV